MARHNLTGPPPDAYHAVYQALSQVNTATGLALTLEGPTTETGNADRAAYQPDRHGKRWAPILVTSSTSTVKAGFVRHGDSSLIRLSNRDQHYVTGQVHP